MLKDKIAKYVANDNKRALSIAMREPKKTDVPSMITLYALPLVLFCLFIIAEEPIQHAVVLVPAVVVIFGITALTWSEVPHTIASQIEPRESHIVLMNILAFDGAEECIYVANKSKTYELSTSITAEVVEVIKVSRNIARDLDSLIMSYTLLLSDGQVAKMHIAQSRGKHPEVGSKIKATYTAIVVEYDNEVIVERYDIHYEVI